MRSCVVAILFITGFRMMFFIATGKRIPSFAGPYTIVSYTTDNETDEFKSKGKIWARIYYSPYKPKQIQYARGYFHSGIEITDDIKMDIRVSSRSNNQWKRNAFVLRFDHACSALQAHFKPIVDLIYYPHEKRCPFPKIRLRDVRNQSYNPVFPDIPILPYARYLCSIAFIQGKEVVGVVVTDGSAVPKL